MTEIFPNSHFVLIDPASFQRRILRMLLEEKGAETITEESSFPPLEAISESSVIIADSGIAPPEDLPDPVIWIAAAPATSRSKLAILLDGRADSFLIKPYTVDGISTLESDIRTARLLRRRGVTA